MLFLGKRLFVAGELGVVRFKFPGSLFIIPFGRRVLVCLLCSFLSGLMMPVLS